VNSHESFPFSEDLFLAPPLTTRGREKEEKLFIALGIPVFEQNISMHVYVSCFLFLVHPWEFYVLVQEVEDAQRIRRTVIDCFERASLPNVSEEERKRILHFAIVGGGPTGVEFAAVLHDFVKEDLVTLYPRVKDQVKITLLEAGDHILNM